MDDPLMYDCAATAATLSRQTGHRRRLWGGAARARALQIFEKRQCIYHFLPPFAPPIFWFTHPIFLTSYASETG